jgi:type II secretory pathway component GspD/PulD (secretin)
MKSAALPFSAACLLGLAMLCASCASVPATRPAGKSAEQAVLVRSLHSNDANEIATVLNNLGFDAKAMAKSNSIVVLGTPDQLNLAQNVIDLFDMKVDGENILFLYPLKNATAQDIAPILQKILDNNFPTHGTDPHDFVVPDAHSNSLMICAPPKYVTYIKELLDQLDLPGTSPAHH